MGCQKVTVELLAKSGKHVRIGIDAPPQIRVVREEVLFETDSDAVVPSLERGTEPSHPNSARSAV